LSGQHQAQHGGCKRLAHAHAVRADQVELQLLQLVLGDARAGQLAEAGVDAVDGGVAGGGLLHHGGAALHVVPGLGRE
jgi:hypothetical protein